MNIGEEASSKCENAYSRKWGGFNCCLTEGWLKWLVQLSDKAEAGIKPHSRLLAVWRGAYWDEIVVCG